MLGVESSPVLELLPSLFFGLLLPPSPSPFVSLLLELLLVFLLWLSLSFLPQLEADMVGKLSAVFSFAAAAAAEIVQYVQ